MAITCQDTTEWSPMTGYCIGNGKLQIVCDKIFGLCKHIHLSQMQGLHLRSGRLLSFNAVYAALTIS